MLFCNLMKMNNGTEQMFILNPAASQPSGSTQKLIEIQVNTQVNLENVSDFSNVCRTCATITEFVIPIFSGEGLQNNLAEKIDKHLPIGVSESDVLPRVVCYQCASTLLAWHELVQCCMQADQALRARIAVDTTTTTQGANKEQKTTNQKSAVIEEDSQSKFKDITEYVVQNMPPPQYSPPTRRCDHCHANIPEPNYKEHQITTHPELVFYCEECDKYIDRKYFMVHMTVHAGQYNINQERKDTKKHKKVKKKKEGDVNQNTETPEAEKPTDPDTQEPKLTKNHELNEFSDHSDTEYGFGPLPESVFEAIEDSQDNQTADELSRTPETDRQNEDSNKAEPETEQTQDDSKKRELRKRPRVCPICSKVYTASSSYFYHMKYTHKRVRDHECTICSKKFTTKASLKIHTATHTGACEFECKQCDKKFKSNASLYIHEQTHTGVKTWMCTQCHQSFRWKTHLMRHVKRHAAEKTHVCSTCGRGFSIRCDLLRHARTHAAGSFSCDKCDLKFAQVRYLKVHMEKKHPKL